MQKRSQKLQSLQDKNKHHFKACASEEEMQKLDEDMEKMRARFQALSEKSGESRRAASEVEEEIRIFRAGEERRGSCASQSNGCGLDPAMVEHFLTMRATQALQQLAFIHGEISRVYGGQHRPEPTAPEQERLG